MSSIGGVGSAGVSSGGGGFGGAGGGGISPVSPVKSPAGAESATGAAPSPGGEGPSNPNTTEGKEHIGCMDPMPGMSTQNFIQINNQVNVNNSVSGIGESGSMEFDLKKLIELMIMLKLIEALSEGGQGSGQGASGQGSGGQGVGANLNITA